MKIINHEANGLQIGQRREDGYVNLTQMAQAYGKRIDNWLRLQDTQDLLAEFERQEKLNPSDVRNLKSALIIKRGKYDGGTWGHPDIAIQFAQWLDKSFALQVSRWVREWITTGQNPVLSQSTEIPTDINAALDQLEQLLVSIRSQARTLHTGTHQPVDETLLKSLHSLTHNQLAVIAQAIGLLQMLRQVASIAQPTSVVEATVEETIVNLPSSESEIQANFITSLAVPSKEATTRLTVDLPDSMHRKLSILAARTRRTKVEIVRMLLDEALSNIKD
jgi:KilA-N domain